MNTKYVIKPKNHVDGVVISLKNHPILSVSVKQKAEWLYTSRIARLTWQYRDSVETAAPVHFKPLQSIIELLQAEIADFEETHKVGYENLQDLIPDWMLRDKEDVFHQGFDPKADLKRLMRKGKKSELA